MSIRLRLTLLYSGVLALTILVFAVGVYVLVYQNLLREIDASLISRAEPAVKVARLLGPGNPGGIDRPVRSVTLQRPPGGHVDVPPPSPSFGTADTYVQWTLPGGGILDRSDNLLSNDISLPAPSASIHERTFTQPTVDGQHLRILVQPIQRGNTIEAYVEVARPLSEADGTLSRLRVMLALGGAGALILATAAGWAMATLALSPIARLSRAAQEIGEAQDFSRRVSNEGPRDEVGRLATTFNQMLSRLQAAYGRIQTALEAQRRFVADASHELRTPLTTIRGNIELLALDDQGESAERKEALDDIASEAERMSRLVSDLLTLARADAGQRIERQPVHIRPIVEEIYRQAQRIAGDVHLQLDAASDALVSGSADHLKQLLLILVDNALKYTPSGGVVQIASEPKDGWVYLSVRDTGPGIPAEDQQRIFERFYRLDPSRHGEGSGLGLSIAQWIASEHGGHIKLQSDPGIGSTFTIVLPLLPDQPEASDASSSSRTTVRAAVA